MNTAQSILHQITGTIKTSELAKALKQASKPLDPPAKPLTPAQIKALERLGNRCGNWKQVKVAKGFTPERVRGNHFQGEIVLGEFAGSVELAPGVEHETGIYNSHLANCVVLNDALILNVQQITNYLIEPGAVLWDDGLIAVTGETTFGNGVELSLAIETGGRELLAYDGITVPIAEALAKSRTDKALQSQARELIASHIKKITSRRGVIAAGARIVRTPKLVNTFVGPFAAVDNARAVLNTTILSNQDESTHISEGAWVRDAIVQWGCEVTTMAIVDASVLTEHSHVERHGKVTQSLVGPNTGIAEGEVTASLVGPFVGFHHQALLIAALWPEGKGNVGYGANVGSNHTAKAPDQELWAGEGTFFGLSVNVKFPANFTESPYSILATGVSTLPQKVSFPFSLINTPSSSYEGISPAYNEIMPGWVLSDNIYTVKRNEGKYVKRNKAKRSQFVFEVFRPDIVDLMLNARARLSNVKTAKPLYTDKEIKGLGKNYLLEESRTKGIEAYTFYIKYYALLGLKRRLEALAAAKQPLNAERLLVEPATDTRFARWEHERKILVQEFGQNANLVELLRRLLTMQEQVAKDVQESKAKDDQRGVRIIDDYAAAHPSAEQDGFVKETWATTKKTQDEITRLLQRLESPSVERIALSG